MLSLAVDFDYHDLRERDYPLLAAPALGYGAMGVLVTHAAHAAGLR